MQQGMQGQINSSGNKVFSFVGWLMVFGFTGTCTVLFLSSVAPVTAPWLPWLGLGVFELGALKWMHYHRHGASNAFQYLIGLLMTVVSVLAITACTGLEMIGWFAAKGIPQAAGWVETAVFYGIICAFVANVLAHILCYLLAPENFLTWQVHNSTPVYKDAHNSRLESYDGFTPTVNISPAAAALPALPALPAAPRQAPELPAAKGPSFFDSILRRRSAAGQAPQSQQLEEEEEQGPITEPVRVPTPSDKDYLSHLLSFAGVPQKNATSFVIGKMREGKIPTFSPADVARATGDDEQEIRDWMIAENLIANPAAAAAKNLNRHSGK